MPLAKKAMSDPRMRQAGMRALQQGFEMGVNAIKQRRRRRKAAGKRIAFAPNYNRNRKNPAMAVGSAGVMAPTQQTSLSVVPKAVTMQATVRQPMSETVSMAEQSITITASANQGQFKVQYVQLCPNTLYFQSLTQAAQRYSYFKFVSVTASFTTSCGTDAPGKIALFWLKNTQQTTDVTTMSDCVRTGVVSTTDSVYKNLTLLGNVRNWDMTHFIQGCTIADDFSKIPSDSEHVQGYLGIATESCSTASLVVGTILISYKCQLIGPSNVKQEPALGDQWSGTVNSTNWVNGLTTHPVFEGAVQPYTLTGVAGTLTVSGYLPCHFIGIANSGGTVQITGSAAVENCTINRYVTTGGAASTVYTGIVVKPTDRTAQWTFTISHTGTASGVLFTLHRIRREDYTLIPTYTD